MFSVVIDTHDSERRLVSTLAALVPGAVAGVVREVIVADGGSTDETEQIADLAGCRFISSSEPLGARLKAAAATARGEWLMFLNPGVVPAPGWIDETLTIADDGTTNAAAFAPDRAGVGTWMREILRRPPRAEQGLMLRKSFYVELGGHRPNDADPQGELLRRIGRRRIASLRTRIAQPDI